MTLQNFSCVWRNQTSAGMHFVELGDNMKIQQLPVFPFNIVQWKDSGAWQDYSETQRSREKQDKQKHYWEIICCTQWETLIRQLLLLIWCSVFNFTTGTVHWKLWNNCEVFEVLNITLVWMLAPWLQAFGFATTPAITPGTAGLPVGRNKMQGRNWNPAVHAYSLQVILQWLQDWNIMNTWTL